MTTAAFLDLPAEVRLQIYDVYFEQHRRVWRKSQPTNAHISFLHTCRLFDAEAGARFRSYVSLRNEQQIRKFLLNATDRLCAQIEHADVANDGRVFHRAERDQVVDIPLSNLHLALARMTGLRRLRVFQCRQGLSINLENTMSMQRSQNRLNLNFERAMFPAGTTPPLRCYGLHTDPETRVQLFSALSPLHLETLRVSGEVSTVGCIHTPALRHLTLHSVLGSAFDRLTFEEVFPDAPLETFTYVFEHKLGFEIRDHHLASLATWCGSRLRKLVLIGCSRLSSAVVTQTLERMLSLEYFAFSLTTVDELRNNFILALPTTLSVFKLQVTNARYAAALKNEERELCLAIEEFVLCRPTRFQRVCLSFRAEVMGEDGRQDRWREIATKRRFNLQLVPWEKAMVKHL